VPKRLSGSKLEANVNINVIFYLNLLEELGFEAKETIQLSTDNTGARDLSYNPEHHKRVKTESRDYSELATELTELTELVEMAPAFAMLPDWTSCQQGSVDPPAY